MFLLNDLGKFHHVLDMVTPIIYCYDSVIIALSYYFSVVKMGNSLLSFAVSISIQKEIYHGIDSKSDSDRL
ncbi:hypothetical protein D3C76_1141190 [compost metagenome]